MKMGHHSRGGGGGASGLFGGKSSIVLLAAVICILNMWMYFSPRGSTTKPHQAGAEGGGWGRDGGRQQLNAVDKGLRQMAEKEAATAAAAAGGGAKKKAAVGGKAAKRTKPKNVLFVMTDDLRPSLSIYDKPVITPAFERLAKGGVVFERAYNQDPICNPSRNSLLSGRRPDTSKVWLFESTVPYEYSNIFRYFKDESDYRVLGTGKLWHWTDVGMDDFENKYFPESTDAWNRGTDENYGKMNASVQPDKNWPEERYWDYKIASEGIKLMNDAASTVEGRPFFLGVGFHQPHRPWHMPQKYWDLYEDVTIPLSPHTTWPIDAPSVATGDINPMEIGLLPHSEKKYWAKPEGGVGMDAIYENVRGYHASVSFLDHQLQRLLDELDRLKLTENTIIVFCVDHGMNIGDHGMWDKRTLYETNARVPLIIRDPDYSENFGMSAPALVENVDIFPTLIEMAGLPDPTDKLFPPLEGKSLVPLLRDPKGGKVKDFAMTQIARCCSNGCGAEDVDKVHWNKWEVCRGGNRDWNRMNERTYMGYSIRTDEWRYTIWVTWNSEVQKAEWEKPLGGEELYDHRDPRCNEKGNFDLCETRNVAADESLKEVKEELYAKLRSIAETYNANAWEELMKEKEARKQE